MSVTFYLTTLALLHVIGMLPASLYFSSLYHAGNIYKEPHWKTLVQAALWPLYVLRKMLILWLPDHKDNAHNA